MNSVVLAESRETPVTLKATSNVDDKAIFNKVSPGSWLVTLSNLEYPPRKIVTIDSLDYELFMDYTMPTSVSAAINVTYPIGATAWVENYDLGERHDITDLSGTGSYAISGTGRYHVGSNYTIGDYQYKVTETVDIVEDGQVVDIIIAPGRIPLFTYTGEYYMCDDSGNRITKTSSNWNIRFTTSGVLTFYLPNGAADGIDVDILCDDSFEITGLPIEPNIEYEIVVSGPGGQSSAFGHIAPVTDEYGYVQIRNTRGGDVNG